MESKSHFWTSRIVSLVFIFTVFPYFIYSCFLHGPEFVGGGAISWAWLNIPRIALAILLILFWNKEKEFDFWAPRMLALSILLVLSIFSLDVFDEHSGFWGILFGLFMHNLPWLIALVLLIIFWKRDLVGGVAFLLTGVFLILLMRSVGRHSQANVNQPFGLLVLPGPVLMSGFLFMVNWFKKKAVR